MINFYTPKKQINKDCMGSFGLGFDLGRGLAGLIGAVKRWGVNIPDMQTVLLATEKKAEGHDVMFGEGPANQTLIASSISGYKQEGEIDGLAYGAMATACPELYKSSIIGCPVKDLMARPNWALFDIKQYRYFPSLLGRVVTMNTSWGCLYKCSYCPYHSYYGKRKAKPMDRIRDELKYIFMLDIRGIVFRDPLFTADREETLAKIQEIANFTIGRHNCFMPYYQWVCETRLEMVDEELLDIMARAGCKAIHFGIEAANDKVLKSVNRSNPPKERQKELIDYCEKIGIKTSCFFVLCFPEDDRQTCYETILHAMYLNPNTAEFFIAQPYPGTKMAGQVDRTEEYDQMNGYTLCFKHQNFTKQEAGQMRDIAYRLFYLRWGWIKKFIKGIFS